MGLISIALLSGTALFGPPDQGVWSFTASSKGEDFIWSSPAPIVSVGSHYEMNYHITAASAMVSYIGIDFGPIDVIELLPEDVIDTWRSATGPAPLNFGWIEVIAPPDQDPPAISYDWLVELDEKGIVSFRMENGFFGEYDYDLGFPWGTVTVSIESGSITADLWVASIPPPCYGDINEDGYTNVTDLLEVIANWGYCFECPADVDNNDVVDVSDLLFIVGEWGPCKI